MRIPPTGTNWETAMIRKSCCTLLLASALALPLHAEDAPKAPTPEEQAMMEAYEKMGRIGEQHQGMAPAAAGQDQPRPHEHQHQKRHRRQGERREQGFVGGPVRHVVVPP